MYYVAESYHRKTFLMSKRSYLSLMEYNLQNTGYAIREQRKRRRWNQDRLIMELREKGSSVSRNTLSAIENGNTDEITIGFLKACCSIFGCDLGHLLQVYEPRTLEIAEISSITGLSVSAAEELVTPRYSRSINTDENGLVYESVEENKDSIQGLSNLLENEEFYQLCYLINKLKNYIPDDNSTKCMPYPFTRTRDDGSYFVEANKAGIKTLEAKAAMEIQLDLKKKYSDQSEKIGLLYGSEYADYMFQSIVARFERIVDSITGCSSYIDRSYIVTEKRGKK